MAIYPTRNDDSVLDAQILPKGMGEMFSILAHRLVELVVLRRLEPSVGPVELPTDIPAVGANLAQVLKHPLVQCGCGGDPALYAVQAHLCDDEIARKLVVFDVEPRVYFLDLLDDIQNVRFDGVLAAILDRKSTR